MASSGEQTSDSPTIAFQSDRLAIAPLVVADARIAATAGFVTKAVTAHLPARLQIEGPVDAEAWIDLLSEGGEVHSVDLEGDLVGFLTLHWQGSDQVMVGYLFAENAWGRGLASELVRGLVAHLQGLGWRGRVTGGVARDNPASAAVLLKAGFSEDGHGPDGVDFHSLDIGAPNPGTSQ